MKTVGTLILIIAFTNLSFAQEKSFQKSKFALKPNNIELKSNIPPFYFNDINTCNDWQARYLAPFKFNPLKFKENQAVTSSEPLNFSSAMPVFKPDVTSFMPISKPNGSVNYHMLIKEIKHVKRAETILP